MNRRNFLLSSILFAAAPRGWAASPTNPADWPRLLVVLLRGGMDGASLLVPHGSDFYYASRPNIAIPRPMDRNPAAAIRLSDYWGLHPAAKDLLPLWQRQQVAFIPFAGSDDTTRSHFEAQDYMELGNGGRPETPTGWMARLGPLMHQRFGTGGISFTANPSLALRGAVPAALNVAVGGNPGGAWDDRQTANLTALYSGHALDAVVREGATVRKRVIDILSEEQKAPSVSYRDATGFERQMRNVAALMRRRPEYALAFTDVGGWDTHVGQGAASGPLAQSFAQLAAGIAGFADEAGPAWNRTVIAVMTEFGRTFRENGSRGTDHGHGSVMVMAGGGLSEAGILGKQVPLESASLFQNRDWPVLNDYREVLAGPLRTSLRLETPDIQQVFPGLTRT